MITGQLSDQNGFRQRLRESFRKEASDCHLVRVAKNDPVYVAGQHDQSVYFVHMGQVKLVMPSSEYREYCFAIYRAGDLFGELCLAGRTERSQTAVAMEDSCLKQFSATNFLARLHAYTLLDGFVQYLIVRLAEEEEMIATLAMLRSEKRLAWTLIHLGRALGQPDAHGRRIARRISQEELAEMVGTTRTRVGIFLKRFREMGLISFSSERHLIVDNTGLESYLDHRGTDDREIRREPASVGDGSGIGEVGARRSPGLETDTLSAAASGTAAAAPVKVQVLRNQINDLARRVPA